MREAFVRAASVTSFGRHEGKDSLDLMCEASESALGVAGLVREEVDGVLCGYSTTLPHLMLSTLFCERFVMRPDYAHGVQVGGATGAAMVMLAAELVRSGRCKNVLVVAGENRLTGQSRDQSIQTLAQVGHPSREVSTGATVPAYYGLLASRYMHETGTTRADLAELAVLMRRQASSHPGAHLSSPLSLPDAMNSRVISDPLHLADCCPISDGGAAVVVSREPGANEPVVLAGAGQAHRHQHISALADVMDTGSGRSARLAFQEAGMSVDEVEYLAIYDSFTITLAMLLEEIGFARRGGAGHMARAGAFEVGGPVPLNTHGGLLSYGHCGVAGGMAHVVEAWLQLAGAAGARQVRRPGNAFIHGDGGVMSSHVSLVFRKAGR
jgi:acetyl-CoA C-acetyltransferase